MLTHHQWGSVAVTREQFHRTAASVQSTVLYNYIENHAFKSFPYLPKENELNTFYKKYSLSLFIMINLSKAYEMERAW